MPLPPKPLPPLPDPLFGDQPGPYARSPLRDICGTRANPDAFKRYRELNKLRSSDASLSCFSPLLATWLRELRGFDARCPGFWQPEAEQWPLPGVIAQVTPSSKGPPFPLPSGTYTLDYASLITPVAQNDRDGKAVRDASGKRRIVRYRWKPWVAQLRSFFPEGSTLLLTFFGNHDATLKLWSDTNWWKQQDQLRVFDAIVAPDFHSFCNSPKPQTFLGERQQQIFLGEGVEQGSTVIPQIAWADLDSLRRQIELWSHAGANTILLNCYASNVQPTLWRQRWLHAIRSFDLGAHHNIRFLIAGLNPGWAIRHLNELFPQGNYALLTTAQYAFVEAQRATVDPTVMQRRFCAKLQTLADLRSGKVVADAKPLPEEMPSFAACKLP